MKLFFFYSYFIPTTSRTVVYKRFHSDFVKTTNKARKQPRGNNRPLNATFQLLCLAGDYLYMRLYYVRGTCIFLYTHASTILNESDRPHLFVRVALCCRASAVTFFVAPVSLRCFVLVRMTRRTKVGYIEAGTRELFDRGRVSLRGALCGPLRTHANKGWYMGLDPGASPLRPFVFEFYFNARDTRRIDLFIGPCLSSVRRVSRDWLELLKNSYSCPVVLGIICFRVVVWVGLCLLIRLYISVIF